MTHLITKTLLLTLTLVAAVVLCAASTPTLTELFGFPGGNHPDGYFPRAPLVQASDGNFYGTTYFGGDDGNHCSGGCAGTVFKITPAGQFTRLHTFAWATEAVRVGGGYPRAGLVEGRDGYLYGTTSLGGSNIPNHVAGIVFKISKTGQFQKLHNFCPEGATAQSHCPDGYTPSAGLVLGRDGNF
jgi:uncharacterized repeat protein (TIGR03803 family)